MGPNSAYPNYAPPPVASPQKRLNPKTLLIGVGALFALIIAGVMLMASGDGGTKNLATQAVAQETALAELAKSAQREIVHPDMSKLNAEAQLLFSSNAQVLRGVAGAYGISSIPRGVLEAATDSDAARRLDQAKLENRYDAAYAAVLKQKMDAQQALLQELYDAARNRVKPDIEMAYQNLQALQESLREINL
jgi:hypothetical protein